MALSFVQYPGNGSQQTFAIPFEYLSREHVSARVNLVSAPFTWDDDNTIRISPAPAPGSVVEARRSTPRDTRLVDFVDGSVLAETDLDLSATQTFFIVQEAIDIAGGTLELKASGSYGAAGRRIEDLAGPINPSDAVTKSWAETEMSSQLSQALSAMHAAQAARNAAQASQAAAASSASAAAGSASAAASQAGLADAARAAAQVARDASISYHNSTLGYRNESLFFRNEAESFKNQAAASAANAAQWDPSSYYTKAEINGRTVRLGGGAGQGTNAVHIGWSGTRLKAQVDATDMGNIVFDSHLATKLDKAGGTLTGSLAVTGGLAISGALTVGSNVKIFNNTFEIEGTDPSMWLHRPNVKRACWHIGADGTLHWLDQNSTSHMRVSGNEVHATAFRTVGGALYGNDGNIYMPWANKTLSVRLSELESETNNRVHRIQFSGRYENDSHSRVFEFPTVLTDAWWNGGGVTRRGSNLQMYVPALGGWVAVWA
jgi:hypothetical protein